MGFKQSIALLFNIFLYIMMMVGLLSLLAGFYLFATSLIVGCWCIDQYYLKRWCLGFHYDGMEEASIETILIQKAETDDIIDIEWKEITQEEE